MYDLVNISTTSSGTMPLSIPLQKVCVTSEEEASYLFSRLIFTECYRIYAINESDMTVRLVSSMTDAVNFYRTERSVKSPTCEHSWKSYKGLEESYDFCEKCGGKNEKV